MPSTLRVTDDDLLNLVQTPEWIIISEKRSLERPADLFGRMGHFSPLTNQSFTSSIDLMDKYIDLCESTQDLDLVMALTRIIQARIS
jgi:hypothetical protein